MKNDEWQSFLMSLQGIVVYGCAHTTLRLLRSITCVIGLDCAEEHLKIHN